MHVVFVEPGFPKNQREFVRALREVGARVTAIGESSLGSLDGELRGWLHGYLQVQNVTSGDALLDALRRIQGREWVDRLETTVEAHILPCAWVREQATIPGTTTRTAFLCRDKPAMKEALREAGVACAASTGTSDPEDVRAFARETGYPIIIKPRDAAGAAGTWRCDDDDALEAAMVESGVADGASVAVEEFVEGHEGFYDTLSVDGRIVHDFICHYYPNVLEAMRERWISPQVCVTNEVEDDRYAEVRALGKRVNEVLGIGTSATHMEWFFGPKGLRFSEIGCRPPGVRVWDLYGAANDIDPYREWAQLLVHGTTDRRTSRAYATGMIALRPDKDGVIASYEGVEQMQERFGDRIIDTYFPPPGTPTQPVSAGYMANAWVRASHPTYDGLRATLDAIGELVKVRAR